MLIDERHHKLHSLYHGIGLFMWIGIATSLLLMAAGMVMSILEGTPRFVPLTPIGELFSGVVTFSPAAFVTAGLIIILALPPAILIISLVHFIKLREIKPIVVCILLLLMFLSNYFLILK